MSDFQLLSYIASGVGAGFCAMGSLALLFNHKRALALVVLAMSALNMFMALRWML